MGTRVELHQFGSRARDALADARRAIEAVDDALTIHRPSPTTTMNDDLAAGRETVVHDPLLRDALTGIATAWAATGGLFDPTVGFDDGPGRWATLRFDPDSGRITARVPASLDFGGFGKGFALDRAVAALRAGSVGCAFLSAGESSVAVIGDHPLGGAWSVAIPHPLDPDRSLVELALRDVAVSVSATVGAGVSAPRRRPTMRPSDGAIVTAPAIAVALAASGAAAEAMSTALLVADDETGRRLRAADIGRRHKFTFPSAGHGTFARMEIRS